MDATTTERGSSALLVHDFMTSPVHSVRDTDRLAQANRLMADLDVSALPVVNGQGVSVGVISRTDLLRAGRIRVQNGARRHVLILPDARVREAMSTTIEVIAAGAPLSDAARRMRRQHMHRLYVSEDEKLSGVLSTRDLIEAVAAARKAAPIRTIMSSGIVAVRPSDPISLAIDRMAAAHRHGLVVVEDGWPVGMFTQEQALSCRDASPEQSVEDWMDPAFVCLPSAVPAFRAAQQMHATRARSVLAVDGDGVKGIVTGLDFAELVQ